ncbi:MAG TPA: BON domain-containing protein [Verrucomicrobia bacterium]|nr:BON domain-containing protein [Verrucomicrobiota bacterium]HOB31615.1 BON domain-containing protein [Verrucomicrobiota bacterium]HOP96539.1 BON domain-containing protein [Verrucomicrobiota bacterium]HPU56846.1 BON domain-containing protein [Verrucomicrobiota bacterium]
MKLHTPLLITCSLLIAAGCAREREYARYDHLPAYSSYPAGAYFASGGSGSSSQASPGADIQPGGSQTGVLVTEVRQALIRDADLAPVAPNLQISSEGGSVTLQGSVESEEQKEQIENVVMQTPGVTRVDNQLRIASETGQLRSSDQLQPTSRTNQWSGQSQSDLSQSATNEAQTLEGQMLEPTASASTNVYQGTAAGGSMSTNAPGELAATGSSSSTNAAQGLSPTGGSGEGGINVRVQGNSASDQNLSRQLTQALRADTTLGGSLSGIQIELEDGNVTLRGSVRSEQQKEAIESAVQRVPGVSSVENQLQVGTSTQTAPLNQ